MFLRIFARKKIDLMNWNLPNIILTICIVMMLVYMLVYYVKDNKNRRNTACNNDDVLRTVSHKLTVPLRIQAYERLLLYIERIQFSVLVKRVFYPGISRDDFQFSLLQNVQDEFEHNLAQRLYVSEETWQLIDLAKEEVLQNINALFHSNHPYDYNLKRKIKTV